MLPLLFVALTILFFPLYLIYKPPKRLIRHFQHRWPDVLWEIPTQKNLIALTIDDAPSHHTREILSVLQENDAAATFFVIGSQIRGHEETLAHIVQGGCELGNHAMYDEPSCRLSDAELSGQIVAVQERIDSIYSAAGVSGQEPTRYFRPGSGFFTAHMRKVVRELGFRIVLGGIYPHDPQIPYWRVNARHVLSMLRPGAIIICHDGEGRGWTVPMLRKVLPEITRRGYRVVTVSELLREGVSS
ncbi:hypothetical protein N7457_009174 [Penicillium paradoxum]|uniref:uncharacterized protein n=1 Tax=Penicillium paradoxum TaxID=176176 RepID=UPI0025487C68|nr:uncharacterized protein N7457_009174 [Penicillium paradoxum]KAJ5774278.1 hypothetical protein N7457_009174 [Penicillium paradoxum]